MIEGLLYQWYYEDMIREALGVEEGYGDRQQSGIGLDGSSEGGNRKRERGGEGGIGEKREGLHTPVRG
ncbi:MAG: hypothetical protein ACE5R6_10260 [Candidatus Heimdallarchaeota archaeon]